MIEYALIFLLVILGLIAVLVVFGPQMAAIYRNISNNL
jgi:Flp pilus assembly pilin Flp